MYKRLKVDEKQLLNCRADVNQLMPIKYTWAWKHYQNGCANHWMPEEISLNSDVKLWNSNNLTERERIIIKRNLGFFVTADSLVANNLVLAVYKHITNPECRQFLLLQGFQEALHSHSYQYCVETLRLDEGEIYNMYHELDCVADKVSWASHYMEALTDPMFITDTDDNIKKLLLELIAFYVIFEGIFFSVGFIQMFALARNGKMLGVSEQFQYIMRDEISGHCAFGVDLINNIILENKHIWNLETKQEAIDMVDTAIKLETAYAFETVAEGILGFNAKMFEMYMKFIGNRRLRQIGLEPIYNNVSNPFPWLSEMMDLRKEKNFFETRVTEYQVGGKLKW